MFRKAKDAPGNTHTHTLTHLVLRTCVCAHAGTWMDKNMMLIGTGEGLCSTSSLCDCLKAVCVVSVVQEHDVLNLKRFA
jgi:hypothetical protein